MVHSSIEVNTLNSHIDILIYCQGSNFFYLAASNPVFCLHFSYPFSLFSLLNLICKESSMNFEVIFNEKPLMSLIELYSAN